MPAHAPLPDAGAVGKLLGALLGRAIIPKRTAVAGPLGAPAVIAVYGHDDGRACAICWADVAIAANLGACLTMIPPAVADESARSGRLAEPLLENAREIFNVAAQLFNADGAPHVVLRSVSNGAPPPDVAAAMTRPRASLHLDVALPGYRGGRLSLLLL